MTTFGFGQGEVRIENEQLKVRISNKGAQLQSILHKETNAEILWIGDESYWEEKSPVMFPVNVRFKDEKYSYKGKEYEMPRMGLAVINTFKLLPTSTPQKAILAFNNSPQSKKYYPFDFKFEITYELVKNKLVNRFKIENTGTDTLYFALGGHPGFNCPFEDGKTRGDYQYVFPEEMTIDRTEIVNSLVHENQISFLKKESRLSLDDTRIPDGGMFLKGTEIRKIGVAVKDQPPFVTVDLGDFPNVNMWSPPGMPFACIEPMLSHHDPQNSPLAIEKKKHLIQLAPNSTDSYEYSIIVHGKKQ